MESPFRQFDLSTVFLIETLHWDGAQFTRLPLHLARLTRGAAGFGWALPDVTPNLFAAVSPNMAARVRLTLSAQGAVQVSATPMAPAASLWRVALSPHRLHPDDPWLGVKSNQRAVYDTTRENLPPGIDEILFANTAGNLCEGTITNVFFDLGQGLCTPPLSCGVLPGCLRADLLATGQAREAILPLADLPRARLWVGNSLRGLIAAQLV